MLLREIFEILQAAMAISVLFEQFSGKLLNCLTLILSISPNIMHIVRTFSITGASGVKLIVIEKSRNYGKFVFIKNIVGKGW